MIVTVIVTISKENPQDEEGHTHTNTRINTDTHGNKRFRLYAHAKQMPQSPLHAFLL